MATGDFTVFEEFAAQIGAEEHDLANDTLKLALIDNTLAPTAADATPVYDATNEVSDAGGYTAGGETLTTVTYTEADGVATLNADNVSILQDVAGFTDAYWGILYNSSNGTNMAIGFLELGGPVSEVAGDITITWNALGIVTVTVS